jgi:hypothetical protein
MTSERVVRLVFQRSTFFNDLIAPQNPEGREKFSSMGALLVTVPIPAVARSLAPWPVDGSVFVAYYVGGTEFVARYSSTGALLWSVPVGTPTSTRATLANAAHGVWVGYGSSIKRLHWQTGMTIAGPVAMPGPVRALASVYSGLMTGVPTDQVWVRFRPAAGSDYIQRRDPSGAPLSIAFSVPPLSPWWLLSSRAGYEVWVPSSNLVQPHMAAAFPVSGPSLPINVFVPVAGLAPVYSDNGLWVGYLDKIKKYTPAGVTILGPISVDD